MGHAWDPITRKSLNDCPDIEEADIRFMEATTIIDEYFASTLKNSTEIIKNYSPLFDKLLSIEHVIILGHSLSSIDSAYFDTLLKQHAVANAQWLIAIRTENEWGEKQQKLAELGISLDRTSYIIWNDV